MTENELLSASRDELIAVIREQQTLIGALQVRISALAHKLSGRNGPGMPGLKPARGKAPSAKERERREKGYGRPRMPPTETVQHVVERCPRCQKTLVEGWVQATREVIEIPLAPVRVSEHQDVARECPHCRTRHVPKVDLDDVVGAEQQRLGIGVASLITTLREEGRWPFATILELTRLGGHLKIGTVSRTRSPDAEDQTSISTGFSSGSGSTGPVRPAIHRADRA